MLLKWHTSVSTHIVFVSEFFVFSVLLVKTLFSAPSLRLRNLYLNNVIRQKGKPARRGVRGARGCTLTSGEGKQSAAGSARSVKAFVTKMQPSCFLSHFHRHQSWVLLAVHNSNLPRTNRAGTHWLYMWDQIAANIIVINWNFGCHVYSFQFNSEILKILTSNKMWIWGSCKYVYKK